MNDGEARASLRVLLAVAQADGKVGVDERQLLAHFASAPTPSVKERVDLDAELAKLESPDARRLTLRAAVSLADLDGRCTPEELEILVRIHAAMGDGGELTLKAVAQGQAAQTARLRAGLEQATASFLHKVASHGEKLGQREYEELVRGLDAARRELIRGALRDD